MSDDDSEIDRKIAMSKQAKAAKDKVMRQFKTLIDRDPQKAVATLRSLFRQID